MMSVHAISHRQIEKYSFTRVDFHNNSPRLCVTPGTRESSTLEMNKNKNNKKKINKINYIHSRKEYNIYMYINILLRYVRAETRE